MDGNLVHNENTDAGAVLGKTLLTVDVTRNKISLTVKDNFRKEKSAFARKYDFNLKFCNVYQG
jgi:hypothetical protein